MKTSDGKARVSKARRLLSSMMAKISTVDGAFEALETSVVIDLLRKTEDDHEACLQAFARARRSQKSLLDYADDFNALALPKEMLREAYDVLWCVATADGILRATEKYLLRDACVHLGLTPDFFDAAYLQHRAAFADEELNEPGT